MTVSDVFDEVLPPVVVPEGVWNGIVARGSVQNRKVFGREARVVELVLNLVEPASGETVSESDINEISPLFVKFELGKAPQVKAAIVAIESLGVEVDLDLARTAATAHKEGDTSTRDKAIDAMLKGVKDVPVQFELESRTLDDGRVFHEAKGIGPRV